MRGFKRPIVLLIGLALPTLLVACGVAESGGTHAGANPSSGTAVVVNGGPATVQAASSSTPSPSPSSATPDTSGEVVLVLDKTSYAPGATIVVTIKNGLSSRIMVTDHHTNCTYVDLQQQVAGRWQPVGECKLMTPTGMVELAAGSITPQRIVIPSGAGAGGTYRVALTYNDTTTTYSITFAVE
ncbi:MAG: hypothetical protein C5B60_12080 [Chloroflexi bacterium]|nr:MAG: hypothetical protein C5B60_12080 [Chloroflexota bacterium]